MKCHPKEITIDHTSILSGLRGEAPMLEYVDNNHNPIPIRNDITRMLESLIHQYNTSFENTLATPITLLRMKELEREIYDVHSRLMVQCNARLKYSVISHMKGYSWYEPR